MSCSAKCASERGASASVTNVGFTSASCTSDGFAACADCESASLAEEALLERGAETENAVLEYTLPSGGLRSGQSAFALLPTSPSRSWRICRKSAGSSSSPLGPFAGPLVSRAKRSDSRVNLQLQLQLHWGGTFVWGYSGRLMDWSRDCEYTEGEQLLKGGTVSRTMPSTWGREKEELSGSALGAPLTLAKAPNAAAVTAPSGTPYLCASRTPSA